MAVKARAYHEVREIRPPPSAAAVKTRFHKSDMPWRAKLGDLQSEFLFELSLTLQAPLDIGLGPEGHRLIIMTSGGRFQGPRLSGTVLPLTGADWPRIRSDGTFAIDARACFRTTEGALIYVTYGGRAVGAAPRL